MNLPSLLQAHLPRLIDDVLRLSLWLAVLSALFIPLEYFFGVRHARRTAGKWLQDIVYYFLTSLLPTLLLALPVALLALLAGLVVPAALTQAVAALPLAVKLLLALLVGETGFYWGHRLSHEIAWLWRFHALHHSTQQLSFLANSRAHPVDLVFTRWCGIVPLYLLGLASPGAAGSAMPLALILLGTSWSFFIHANLRWRFEPLEWLVSTPAFHHWHHTRNEHINRNYAAMLPLLDRVFGTYYLPRHWPSAYGTDTPVPATLSGQLIGPLSGPLTPAPTPLDTPR